MDDVDAGKRLPLGQALLKWGDQALLDAAHQADEAVKALWGAPSKQEIRDTENRVIAARQALFEDFRCQVERGAIHLQGVQTAPVREAYPTSIPDGWAADMEIDFAADSVVCAEYRWIAVTAVPELPIVTVATPPTVISPRPAPEGEQGRRQRGREAYTDLILEALSAHYRDREMAPAPAHGWSALARTLATILEAKHPDRHAENRLPGVDTMRTRLPALYKKMRDERSVL